MNNFIKMLTEYATSVVLSLMLITLFSCEDDNVGNFELTGNIEHLIPKETYLLRTENTSDGRYFACVPDFNSNFEYWGLCIEKVDFYIDGALYKTVKDSPFGLVVDKKDLEEGNHELLARITVTGAKCEDAVIEISAEFNAPSKDSMNKKRHGDFYILKNDVTKGEEFVIIPELLVSRSSEGCQIDEVKYYWDEDLSYTVTEAPFEFRRMVTDEIGTNHRVKVVILYHDNLSKNLEYIKYTNVKVQETDEAFVDWDMKSGFKDYKNGEILSLVACSYKGPEAKDNYQVEFYLDEMLIGKSSSFPYTLDYKLENITEGIHVIKCTSKSENDGVSVSSSSERNIILIE